VVSGGRSRAQADTPNGVCRTPNTTATSTTAGPISGASQYIAATMYPQPSHQPRTAASRADGDRRMISRPGTSPNQATTNRSGAGKASSATAAPVASAAHRAGCRRERGTTGLRRRIPQLSARAGVSANAKQTFRH
jgi:hypothetical protein